MSRPNPKTARAVAVYVLNRFDPKQNYAGVILNTCIGQLEAVPEKQRATDLVLGTIRNRTAIDAVTAGLANCPVERIHRKVLNIIRVGVYELLYCPATPEYSVVNEAVETAKAVAGSKQAGFVNAVLRKITRHIINRQAELAKAEPAKTIPQTTLTGCEFDTAVLCDIESSSADFFSTVFSLPLWLVNNWLREFGSELTRQICFAGSRRPSIYLRPNTLKTTAGKIAENLRRTETQFHLTDDKSMLQIKGGSAVTALPGFKQGDFTVQDMTAAEPVRLLKPQPGWKILDMCAAPGTKTSQLAEYTGDKAQIFATDINPERLRMVEENACRLGIKSIRIIPYERIEKDAGGPGPFDCILVDVPCSNTGVLSKRLEVRFRLKPGGQKKPAETQLQLLESAAGMIKTGGRICYSTCSIQSEENNLLVRKFLERNPHFKLAAEKLTLPTAEEFDHDGGYVAIISKRKYKSPEAGL